MTMAAPTVTTTTIDIIVRKFPRLSHCLRLSPCGVRLLRTAASAMTDCDYDLPLVARCVVYLAIEGELSS